MGYLQCSGTTPKTNLPGREGRGVLGFRGVTWGLIISWVPIPLAPKPTNREEYRDSQTSVIVTMDMEEKYMEPIKLKSNPYIKAMELKPYFKFFLRGGRLVLRANLVRAAGFLNNTMSNCQGGTSAPPGCSPQKLTSWNLWSGFARTSNTNMGMTTQGLSNKYYIVGLGWHCGVCPRYAQQQQQQWSKQNWHVKNNFLRVSLFVLSCPEAQNLVRYGLSRETHDKLQSPNPKAHNKWQSKEHPNSKDGGYVYYFIVFFFFFFQCKCGKLATF